MKASRTILYILLAILIVYFVAITLGRLIMPGKMPGALPGLEIIYDNQSFWPFILPMLVGWFATDIFKNVLYGRFADLILALLGGCLLYFPTAQVWNRTSASFGSNLAINLFFSAVTIVGALIVLFLARKILKAKPAG